MRFTASRCQVDSVLFRCCTVYRAALLYILIYCISCITGVTVKTHACTDSVSFSSKLLPLDPSCLMYEILRAFFFFDKSVPVLDREIIHFLEHCLFLVWKARSIRMVFASQRWHLLIKLINTKVYSDIICQTARRAESDENANEHGPRCWFGNVQGHRL